MSQGSQMPKISIETIVAILDLNSRILPEAGGG